MTAVAASVVVLLVSAVVDADLAMELGLLAEEAMVDLAVFAKV